MAGRGFTGAVMRAYGAIDHVATRTGSVQLTDHCVRVRFHSDTLFDDLVFGPTSWIRAWFPDDKGKEFQRGYTFAEADPETGDFAIDFVLHQPAGPASQWAKETDVGASIEMTSMSSSPFEIPDENRPAGYLLIGDSASLPAIRTIIGIVPDDLPIELYLEEHDVLDRDLPLAEHPRLRIHWVKRADASSVAAALETRDWSNWYAWLGPESASLKELRKRIKEFGFPKSEIHAQAYWVQGKAMGKERDPDAETAAPEVETIEPEIVADEPEAMIAASTTGDLPTQGTWRAAGAGRLLGPLKGTLIAGGVLQAIVTLIQLAPYLLLVELGRRLLGGADSSELWLVGIVAVVLLGLGTILESALLIWLHAVDGSFSRDLRQRLLTKLSHLPLGWFTDRNAGSIKTLVQDNTLSLHYLVTHAVPDAVAAVVAPVAVLVYLFVVDWRIALFLLIPVLAYIVTLARMMVVSGPKIPLAQTWAERMNGEAAAYLEAQPVIRTFGGVMSSRFRHNLDGYLSFLNNWQRPFITAKTVMDLMTRPTTFLWLIAVVGTFFVVWGWAEPVDLLPFLLLGTTFGARLLGISYGLQSLKTGMIAARDIQETIDATELSTAPIETVDDDAGAVVFDDVTFGYRPDTPVLRGISLRLEPGTVTALVGPSGSGKSTLAALLARFHDVDSGAIRIGGRDIRSLESDELYHQLGFVLQQTQLVHGTVAENIALAVPDASRERIEAAAHSANIHDRIQRMPGGYDTVLGPDAALSGGERQRLAIARALLADAPVIILDEATAFADPESEYLVQQSLSRLAADRTVLVIAHRLHTVVDADTIVVLDGGRIVEEGRHSDLVERGGRYTALWESLERDVDEQRVPVGAKHNETAGIDR
ncbi:ATP-binding cassette domain-containing protein [Gordonia sp. ABSL11-1]|uniref:ABC transporter ATP-binding protein/permease n=1 Tax=Gordonia sp. ABSL11-1 TaxID=3053924 RepID=UPI002573663A|nr:ATP-binding cassette domain-containing protein [Gordonia sp. ABSL11-1]MDL9947150.1 ATP-binding cassette domain-containing protein [Gordonia sp. ABSL11-1]